MFRDLSDGVFFSYVYEAVTCYVQRTENANICKQFFTLMKTETNERPKTQQQQMKLSDS